MSLGSMTCKADSGWPPVRSAGSPAGLDAGAQDHAMATKEMTGSAAVARGNHRGAAGFVSSRETILISAYSATNIAARINVGWMRQ